MNSSNQIIGSYYFKVVRTTNSKTYLLPSNIPIQEFFRLIKLHVMDDFGYESINCFEIVQSGQQIEGYQHAEDVPAINISSLTGTLYENYNNFEAFYIRPINLINLINNNITVQPVVQPVELSNIE